MQYTSEELRKLCAHHLEFSMQYTSEELRKLYKDMQQERNVLAAALTQLGYGDKLNNLKALIDLELATPKNIRTILFTN